MFLPDSRGTATQENALPGYSSASALLEDSDLGAWRSSRSSGRALVIRIRITVGRRDRRSATAAASERCTSRRR
jgi:hypothetical protein